jgi:hypothetical protein
VVLSNPDRNRLARLETPFENETARRKQKRPGDASRILPALGTVSLICLIVLLQSLDVRLQSARVFAFGRQLRVKLLHQVL